MLELVLEPVLEPVLELVTALVRRILVVVWDAKGSDWLVVAAVLGLQTPSPVEDRLLVQWRVPRTGPPPLPRPHRPLRHPSSSYPSSCLLAWHLLLPALHGTCARQGGAVGATSRVSQGGSELLDHYLSSR